MNALHPIPERISDRVARLRLPLPLPGLSEVNCYVILGPDGVTLVDPGWLYPEGEQALRNGLRALGVEPADVPRILVTHAHWDHYSLAMDWMRHGVEVLLGHEERHTVTSFDHELGLYPGQVRLLRSSGADRLADRIENLELENYERDIPTGAPTEWIRPNTTLDCGGVEVHARTTPGHTRGHTVFEIVEDELLISGDHVLPRITPSVGFEVAPEESPLTSFLQSLRDTADGPALRMLPAHGHTDGEVSSRASELLEHHRERLDVVRSLVPPRGTTAFDVAGRMRWTRRNQSIDDLAEVHAMNAVLEVRAHLDHLAGSGQVTKKVVRDREEYFVA
ncbi:MBL fold metallo-hydrolase [Dietzia maris]|uniref:MBL fold metallo-hydrolase n=1 Tax=Dietzia maris TaxID=37915 RepID=UPI0037C96EEF